MAIFTACRKGDIQGGVGFHLIPYLDFISRCPDTFNQFGGFLLQGAIRTDKILKQQEGGDHGTLCEPVQSTVTGLNIWAAHRALLNPT